MICPQCGKEQYCPCNNCKERSKGKTTWVWINEDVIKCGHCELTAVADWWETEAWKQYKQTLAKKEESKHGFK